VHLPYIEVFVSFKVLKSNLLSVVKELYVCNGGTSAKKGFAPDG